MMSAHRKIDCCIYTNLIAQNALNIEYDYFHDIDDTLEKQRLFLYLGL